MVPMPRHYVRPRPQSPTVATLHVRHTPTAHRPRQGTESRRANTQVSRRELIWELPALLLSAPSGIPQLPGNRTAHTLLGSSCPSQSAR